LDDYLNIHEDEWELDGTRFDHPQRDLRVINEPILVKLTKKIEQATKMRLSGRDSATQYQVSSFLKGKKLVFMIFNSQH